MTPSTCPDARALPRSVSFPWLATLMLGTAIAAFAPAAGAQDTSAPAADASGSAASGDAASDAASASGEAAGSGDAAAGEAASGAAGEAASGTPAAGSAGGSAGAAADAEAGPAVTAALADADGKQLGNITIQETPSGLLHVSYVLTDLPEGTRAMHIHETGKCEGPTFESAGGHLAGGKEHGVMSPGGPHIGDMPNITPGQDGSATGEFFLSGGKVADMLDDDGAAVIIHATADDYRSQPSGEAGDRIACGVLAQAQPAQ